MSQLSLSNPTGRNTQARVLTMGNVMLFFSYKTLIAARNGNTGQRGRVANSWGPTTGRHFRELGCSDFPMVADEAALNAIVEGR